MTTSTTTNIGNEIIKNKFLIIAIILLTILIVVFFANLYFNIRQAYFPNKKQDDGKEFLFFKRLKYIIILILFLLSLTVLYIVNPYNVISNYLGTILLFSIFIGTVIITMLSWYNYAYKKESIHHDEASKNPPPVNYFKKAFLFILFGGIAGLIIYLLIILLSPFSSQNSFVSFILNILIIIIILSLVYKVFNINNNSNLFSFIINILLIIPKIFLYLYEIIVKFAIQDYNATANSSILLLLFTMVIMYFYFKLPSLEEKINLQGGKQLISMPINTTDLTTLASYEQLNGSDNFEYKYAISFWVYINSYPPNTNYSYDTFVSLLNYGDNPNVLFNINNNTLMITMKHTGDVAVDSSNNLVNLDANGNKIIYIKKNFLLQKWNNIIINFNGGTLDIFLNGELVKSSIGNLPYMKLENLTVGSEKGIGGGICNLIYFDYCLTSNNIYYIYNMVKNNSPPVIQNSNETIIKMIS